MAAQTLPFSAACERNKDPILDILRPYLENIDSALEIGSGTAQHAVHFAAQCPHLFWQTSDQTEYLAGIRAQIQNSGLINLPAPLCVDVQHTDWSALTAYPLIFTANTLHIMNEQQVMAFLIGARQVCKKEGWLAIYGPFKYDGVFTSPSNYQFDQSLRARGQGSAIRDFVWISGLAEAQGFELANDHVMPANNQLLIWQRTR